MKPLPIERRIEIYENGLAMYKSNGPVMGGFCICLGGQMSIDEMLEYGDVTTGLTIVFPELLKYEPGKHVIIWFNFRTEGIARRIEILEEILSTIKQSI